MDTPPLETRTEEQPLPESGSNHPAMEHIAKEATRRARQTIIFVVGGTVLVIGVALIVLPGPAFVVIPAGLSILAIEFEWSRRWLKKISPENLKKMFKHRKEQ